jgi:hypothetical protein
MLLLLGHWWWRLSQKLVRLWIFRSLPVLARDTLAESINLILLLMSRKRKRDVFGKYLVWIRALVPRKNSRQYIASGESSGVPSPALSALVGLQELSLANFDQTLEDMVPEDLLSEPADDGVMEVCADVFDAGLRSSHASSTLERGLKGQETDLDHLGPMEVTEGLSALEAATAENLAFKDGVDAYPAPKGVAEGDSARVGSASHCPAPEGTAGDDPAHVGSTNYDPALEGVRAGSPSCTSMDVHAGSPPHSGCMVVAQALDQGVALEGSVPAGQVLSSVDGTELVPAGLLQAASGGDLTPGR